MFGGGADKSSPAVAMRDCGGGGREFCKLGDLNRMKQGGGEGGGEGGGNTAFDMFKMVQCKKVKISPAINCNSNSSNGSPGRVRKRQS